MIRRAMVAIHQDFKKVPGLKVVFVRNSSGVALEMTCRVAITDNPDFDYFDIFHTYAIKKKKSTGGVDIFKSLQVDAVGKKTETIYEDSDEYIQKPQSFYVSDIVRNARDYWNVASMRMSRIDPKFDRRL